MRSWRTLLCQSGVLPSERRVLPQLFSCTKLKKAAAGKENHACFDFVDKIKAMTLGSSPHFTY